MKTRLCKYINFFPKANLIVFFLFFAVGLANSQMLSPDYMEYIATYSETAVRQQQEYGIPASITLAQGLLESAAGRSRLAREGNNHFGIKCHKLWKGGRISHQGDCYRSYDDAYESFEDHARFLKQQRYAPLYKLDVTDYEGWAKGLRKCGYATDPAYARKLVSLIELYGLDRYDTGQPVVAQRKELAGDETLEHSIDMDIINEFRTVHKLRRKWGLHYVTVIDGDDYGDIADEFGIKWRKLRSYNDLPRRAAMLPPGTMLYLQEKHDTAPEGCPATYVATEGDTPHLISQKFGIRLKSLLKLNGLKKKSKIEAGDVIRLR